MRPSPPPPPPSEHPEPLLFRGRGRPFHFPTDPSTPGSLDPGSAGPRIGWLLATARTFARHESVRRRTDFMPLLKAHGVVCDAARVSRWETGSSPASLAVIRAYEVITQQPTGGLVGLAQALRPVPQPVEGDLPAEIARELDRHFTMPLEVRTGADDLDLAALLATRPSVYLRPSEWERLAERLVHEMVRSVGSEYVCRYQALRLLMAHHGGRRHVLRAIGSFVTNPEAHGVTQPLSLLQEVGHPRAQTLVLRMLIGEASPLLEGAAWAAAAKLVRGHFDDVEHLMLERIVAEGLAAPDPDRHVDLVDIAARLPVDHRTRLLQRGARGPLHRRLERVTRHGEIVQRDKARDVAARVAEATQASTPAGVAVQRDEMLQRLIRDALFHGHQQRRHEASLLLAASPYRSALARQLAGNVVSGGKVLAFQSAALLRHCATREIENVLSDQSATHPDPGVREMILIALGRMPAFPSPASESTMAQAALTDPDPGVRRAAVYALGMHASAELDRLAGHERPVPGALWW